jgi:hypothetical protein
MSNRTYICIKCRTTKRAEAHYGFNHGFKCPICHKNLWELEWRWRIPKKTDDKGWAELEKKVITESEEWLKRRYEMGLAEISKVEKQIEHYQKQKDTDKKEHKIKELYKKIEIIKLRHNS